MYVCLAIVSIVYKLWVRYNRRFGNLFHLPICFKNCQLQFNAVNNLFGYYATLLFQFQIFEATLDKVDEKFLSGNTSNTWIELEMSKK